MTIKLGVSVMAHQRRAKFVPRILEKLGIGEEMVSWDRHNDRWDTGRRAWEMYDPTCTHWCVIQDDALICNDFIAGMEKALAYITEPCLVSPYIGTRRPTASRVTRAVTEAKAAGAAWVRMPSLNWGVAIMAPTSIIPQMLPWCDKQTYPNYDRRIGRFAIDVLRLPTWCTWPSLVDHRDDDSLVGHGQGRKAHQFIGQEASALDVDWSTGHVTLGGPGAVRGRRFPKRPVAGTVDTSSPNTAGVLRVAQNRQIPAKVLRVPRPGFKPDVPPMRPPGT